jgi:hypothetical protein
MDRRTLIGVGALACAALLLESTLTRLLAVAQYYHFAFLVVSLALLGFGASGTALALSSRLSRMPLHRLLSLAGPGFALSAGLAYAVVNLLPFDSYSIAWERRQVLFFLFYYLALTLPFFCAGLGIGAALASGGARAHLLYAANLFGSAAGALLAPALLALAGVPGAVLASALVALIAGPLPRPLPSQGRAAKRFSPFPRREGGWGVRFTLLLAIVVLAALNAAGRAPLGMTISPYKGLAHALRYPGAHVTFSRWNAVSRADVVAGAGTRGLPGLSYTYPGAPPEQRGLSLDAESLQPVTLARASDFDAAAYLPEAPVFALTPGGRALVVEPGGGLAVLQALAGGAGEVTIISGNSLAREAVSRAAGEFDPYAAAGLSVAAETARVHLARDRARYDVVFLPLTDPYRPVASGAYSLGETYNLTVEALAAALERLSPGGTLAVTRWLQTPPSEDLRLFATLVEALASRDVDRPGDALVAYRGIQTLTVLVRPGGWSPEALAQVRAFAEARRYDLVWAPDVRPGETNRFNRMPEQAHYEAFRNLLAAPDRRAFYAAYPFSVAPATDDRPFFFHFFRWGQTPQVLATLGRTWQPFGGSGYFVLLALLALVLLLSALLILLPLAFRPTDAVRTPPGLRARALAYFGLLGLAFLFVEIPLIQRAILSFGQPAYAFTVVVLTVLVFSGIGSALSPRLPARAGPLLAALLALSAALLGPVLLHATLGWPVGWRLLAAVATLAPLALALGLPFPAGLAWLGRAAPALIPWAWAVNGCASVVASVLAALIALSGGLTVVLLLGATAYALAWLLLPGSVVSPARVHSG